MTHTRYAFIKAQWHADIVDQALTGFTQLIPADQVDVFDVPGAFEMPLLAQELAKTGNIPPSPALRWLWMAASTDMILLLRPWLTG